MQFMPLKTLIKALKKVKRSIRILQCQFPEIESAQNYIIFSIDKAKKTISDFFHELRK